MRAPVCVCVFFFMWALFRCRGYKQLCTRKGAMRGVRVYYTSEWAVKEPRNGTIGGSYIYGHFNGKELFGLFLHFVDSARDLKNGVVVELV